MLRACWSARAPVAQRPVAAPPDGAKAMRLMMFVLCFTVGVSLMIFSGYVPRSASARTDVVADGTSSRAGRPHGGDDSIGPARTSSPRSVWPPASTNRPAWRAGATAEDGNLVEESEQALDTDEQAEIQENVARALQDLDQDLEDTLEAAEEDLDNVVEVKAEAGPDRIVWIGWDDIALDGSRSVGEDLTCVWKQISGPTQLHIRQPTRMVTRVSGFPLSTNMGWSPLLYEFELTVTDGHGRQATDIVGYVMLPGPELTIRPPAQRRFELRDGYVLGHYTAWTSAAGDTATFEIASPTGLFFTQISGPACDIGGGQSGDRFAYRVVVYGEPGQTTSWAEFLVDTDEKIPGIVQLGVNWE
jgi:hypothetical protein